MRVDRILQSGTSFPQDLAAFSFSSFLQDDVPLPPVNRDKGDRKDGERETPFSRLAQVLGGKRKVHFLFSFFSVFSFNSHFVRGKIERM